MASNQDLVARLSEQVEALEAELARISQPPYVLATVCGVVAKSEGDVVLLAAGGAWPSIVPCPTDPTIKKAMKPGTQVAIHPQSGAIMEVFAHVLPGVETTVKRVFDESPMIEVDGNGGSRQVYRGQALTKVKAGDKVLLDQFGQVALRRVPKNTTNFSVNTGTGVKWEDIGGQDEAKLVLAEVLADPIKHSELHKGYGKRPVKGVLLYGPPGTGKTLIAKASANMLREMHGKAEAGSGFIYVKGPEVLDMWVGNTEATIRSLFTRAREHQAEFGYPALLFIDEADALLGKRDSRHGSTLSTTIVPTFLAEMDGIEPGGAFVMLATNRPDVLDPAITRDGRIDRKIKVDRPDRETAEKILAIYLKKTKLADPIEKLTSKTAAGFFSTEYPMYNVALNNGKGTLKFNLFNMVSGAMLAGVVDAAVSLAIRGDIEAKRKAPSGVTLAHMRAAVEQIWTSNRNLNHEDDIAHFVEAAGHSTQSVGAVQRIVPTAPVAEAAAEPVQRAS